ncbi:MAG: hypothetical protein ACR2JB_03750 [Bryobacteraceae bacterium]
MRTTDSKQDLQDLFDLAYSTNKRLWGFGQPGKGNDKGKGAGLVSYAAQLLGL